jgi:3-oxoacyl-[acyl-carrier-protein] synthase-1
VVLDAVKPEELAFVNVHGTATRYNDQMEAIALNRAGLQDVPVNALKGTFGHTMGAAGILESIVSMQACDAGVVLPTKGFSTIGVDPAVSVSARERNTDKKAFVKLLSGFGGVNGALLFRKGGGR